MAIRAIEVKTPSPQRNMINTNWVGVKMASVLTTFSTDHWMNDGNVTAHA
jgi:hypothetical protein